jgi:GT2 family glycosyltransferase
MTQAPEASVVVPVYDAERTITECLDSLLAQDFPSDRYEIIAIDNASRDRTPELLRRYAGRIAVLEEHKQGPAAARNRGVKAARGEIIAMTDSDCVVSRDWLRCLIAPLDDPAVGIVGGRNLSTQPCNDVERFGEEIHDHEKAITVYKPPYVITMNWAARASLFETIGYFDEDLLRCEDVDLAYRAVQHGYRLAYAPDAVVHHRNERTLAGLFAEGFAHGLYSVQAIRKHDAFLASHGHRSFDPKTYAAIRSAFTDWMSGRDSERSLCVAVFNGGKKLGKATGSIRFRHLEL